MGSFKDTIPSHHHNIATSFGSHFQQQRQQHSVESIKMLQREALVLAKRILHEPNNLLRVTFVRSLKVAAHSNKLSKQNWRITRKKIGPSTSKAVILEADKDANDHLRSSIVADSNLIDDEISHHWVPPAYRGVVDQIKLKPGSNSVLRHRLQTLHANRAARPRRVGKPTADRYILQSKDGTVVDVPTLGLPKLAVIAKQRKEQSIMKDIAAFKMAAKSYKTHLCECDGDTTPVMDDWNSSPSVVSPLIKSFQEQIGPELRSLHENVSTNAKGVDNSHTDFLLLCQALQQICSTACHLSTLRKYQDKDANTYLDLAEFTLLGLVQINHDRLSLLLEHEEDTHEHDTTTRTATNTTMSMKPEFQSSVTGWFNQIVEGLTPSLLAAKISKPEEPHGDSTKVEQHHNQHQHHAIDTATLQSIQRLLRNVISMIASTTTTTGPESTIPLVTAPQGSSNKSSRGHATDDSMDETLGQRMITLLEKTWTLRVHDDEATQHAMEVLARTGTLENARLCHDVYQKHSESVDRHVSFSVVLEAYLETIKRETDPAKVHDIVDEVMNIHNSAPWISHRVERIINAAIVLNCLAAADMGKVDGMCGSAELIVKRALREKPFIYFVEQVESEHPKVDNLLVPIANFLAQLYGTSDQPVLVATSVKLLKYALADVDGVDTLSPYPTAETCNTVLQALVHAAGGKDSTTIQSDYEFARKILKYMFSKTETGSGPTQTTYDCLFALLEATNASDIGTSGEELLLHIETNNLLNGSSTFCLPYRTYHRVLQYYLKMAKSPIQSKEKNLPYRRASHLLRKLEIRSSPMVLSNIVLGEIAVEKLYVPTLRPTFSAYELVMKICANTSQRQYQDEAADVAIEIYRTKMQYFSEMADCWDTVLENYTNAKLAKRVNELTKAKQKV